MYHDDERTPLLSFQELNDLEQIARNQQFTHHASCRLPRYESIQSIAEFETLIKSNHTYNASNFAVFFDLDDVLAIPEDPMACDEAFSFMNKNYEEDLRRVKPAMRKDLALNATLVAAFPYQRKTKLRIIELKTIEFINELQDAGVRVYVLTSRSVHRWKDTIAQLRNIGLDFSRSVGARKDIKFKTLKPSRFFNGIMYCGPNDKGDMLYQVLHHLKIVNSVECVFFIDDRQTNCRKVMAAMGKYGIPAFCRRYARLDAESARFEHANIPVNLRHLTFTQPDMGRDCLSPKAGPTNNPFAITVPDHRPFSR